MFEMLFQSTNPLFESFSVPHLILIAIPVLWIVLMIFNKKRIKTMNSKNIVWFSIIGLLLSQQILLYSWYYFTGNFDFTDALPLYPCRISSLLCIGLMLFWNESLFDLLFFMGLPGASLALMMPDTWNLGFPNAMFIQFFAGHSAILITIFYLVIRQDYHPTRDSWVRAMKITTVYLGILIIINPLLGSNYGYMAQKPEIGALAWMPSGPWHIPIFIGFMYSIYWGIYCIWPKKETGSISETSSDREAVHATDISH